MNNGPVPLQVRLEHMSTISDIRVRRMRIRGKLKAIAEYEQILLKYNGWIQGALTDLERARFSGDSRMVNNAQEWLVTARLGRLRTLGCIRESRQSILEHKREIQLLLQRLRTIRNSITRNLSRIYEDPQRARDAIAAFRDRADPRRPVRRFARVQRLNQQIAQQPPLGFT